MQLRNSRTVSAKVQEAQKPPLARRKRKTAAKRKPTSQKLAARPAVHSTPIPPIDNGSEVQREEDKEDLAQERRVRTPEQPSFYGQSMDEFMRTPSEGDIPNLQSQASVVRFEDEVNLPRRQTLPQSSYSRPGRSSSVLGPSQRSQPSQTPNNKRRALSTSPVDDNDLPNVRLALQVKVNRSIIYSRHYDLWNVDISMVKADIQESTQEYCRERTDAGNRIKASITSHPMATITAFGLKNPIHQTCRKGNDLDSVREEVWRLYRTKRVKEIQVIVGCEYSVVIIGQRTPSPIDNERTPTVQPQSQSRQPSQRPQRETASQRMRRQQEVEQVVATATNNSALDIANRLQCKDRSCFNYGHTCFPTKSLGHLRVTGLDLTVWNEGIQAGRASLECPPADMIAGIIARGSKAKGKASNISPAKVTSTAGNTYIISGGGDHIPAIPGLGWGTQNHLRSSPPSVEGSEVDNLKEYIYWLIRKGHISSDLGERARSALLAEGWGFQQLRDIPDLDWKEMGVPRGAVVIIRQKMKLWIQWKQRKAVAEAVQEGVVDLSDVEEVDLGEVE